MTALMTDGGEPIRWARRVNQRGQVLAVHDPVAVGASAWSVWENGDATTVKPGELAPPHPDWVVSITDITDRGKIIGQPGDGTPFFWQHGLASPIAVADDTEGVAAFTAVNERGTAPRYVQDEPPQLWRDGELTVAPEELRDGMPVDINDRNVTLLNVPSPQESVPVEAKLWSPDGEVTELGSLEDTIYSRGYAINERGHVAGGSWTADGGHHAFLWHRGEMTDLGTLGGEDSYIGSGLTGVPLQLAVLGLPSARVFGPTLPDPREALSDRGHVVGTSETTDGETHAFLWWRGQMTDLGTLGGDQSIAYAVNNRGQVVGRSTTASGQSHAFFWDDGQMTDLGAVADPGEGSRALDINDRGQIVGHVGSPRVCFCSDPDDWTDVQAVMWEVPRSNSGRASIGRQG